MSLHPETYYDSKYFDSQRGLGSLNGVMDAWKFRDYIKPTDTVLDFGCGGGYILKEQSCAKRYGVEINPVARKMAEANGVEVYSSTRELLAQVERPVDVVVSNHALEHTRQPATELESLHEVLRQGGLFVMYLPLVAWSKEGAYDPNDWCKHLYCWTPQNIGNLIEACGYEVREARLVHHLVPPFVRLILNWPEGLRNAVCYAWSRASRLSQTKVVAIKP